MMAPTRRRKARTRPRSKSAPPVLRSPLKRGKRKQWSNEAMLAALEAVKNGTSIKRAALQHGVPRTTLSDRHLGKVVHGSRPGPQSYLSQTEESELGTFIQVVGELGYGKTRKQIKNIAESVARDKGILKSKRISDGWFRRFLERQPHLCLRKGDPTANVRMNAMANTEALDNYFRLLQEVMEDNELMDKPGQIYNVDESGMPLDHRPPHVLTTKGEKKVRYRTSGNKSQITVIGCVNAAGQAIPPFVIFDAKSLNMEWTEGEVPGTTYGLSNRGWIDMELFKRWFTDHFLKFAVSARPILLLLDGHSSHYNPEAIRHAKENDVILFTLVPHTTHEMQPLDTAVFGPLKSNWREACHDYIQSNPGRVVTKYQFSSLLSQAWMKTMVPSTIISGFKTCGVYPFNPMAVIDHNPCTMEDTADASLNQEEDNTFTVEQEVLFKRRYEEGYDIYDDPKYVSWLREYHPETAPIDDCTHQENNDPLSHEEPDVLGSLADHFPDASPCEPLIVVSPDNHVSTLIPETGSAGTSHTSSSPVPSVVTQSLSPAAVSVFTSVPPSTAQDHITTKPRESAASSCCSTPPNRFPTPSASRTNSASMITSSTPSTASSTPVDLFSMSGSSQSSNTKSKKTPLSSDMISKYLVQYVPETPKGRETGTKRVTGARVLTSAQGLSILKEREEKKKKETEEKEKRKQERIDRKKEKEELAKKKAEEKAKKCQKKISSQRKPTKRKTASQPKGVKVSVSASSKPSTSNTTSGEPSTSSAENECCECLRTYNEDIRQGTGVEWVQCSCGRWLHEECIDSILQDADGKERFCSFCVV